MPCRSIRQHHQHFMEFDRCCIVGLNEAGWSYCAIARPVGHGNGSNGNMRAPTHVMKIPVAQDRPHQGRIVVLCTKHYRTPGHLRLPSGHREWYLKGDYLIIIASLFILPLALMRQLGYLGYTSGLSLICMVFFLISVIYKKFNVGCPVEDHNLTQPLTVMVNSTSEDDVCEAKLITFNSRTAYAIPIVSFAFVCQPVVLPIYTELWKPTKKRMQRVANISVLAMFVMYLLTAVFGYLTFYDKVESELLHTYKGDNADHLILCVRLAVLMAVTLSVPVIIFPIRRALLQLFFDAKHFNWVLHISIAIGLLVLVNILVILVPNIKDIFGVTGATSAPTLIFILPGIFYIRTVPENLEPLNSRPKIQAACFAAVGFLLMVVSISLIIMDWASGGQ
ncbi:sodium-coupled neutral amino acid transporter 5-like isoform X3 [Paramormyrops kingsleyae]|uniref:sodium-coupled neutral amino acid transporter 5-like isoform X3 n=1 Tax=Paramormyrops kingsleyae TaxID=1676925 RepID=UPI000CD64606|nr:sodium-coupled neutral amino acid transporter 5-like isoform X1 [Paramormyrops kingsleyae]